MAQSDLPRICTLVDRFPPLIGGVELQAAQLSSKLHQAGVSVIVVTRRINTELPAQDTIGGVPVYRIPPGGRRSHLVNILSVPVFVWFLLRHRQRYDIMHVHDMFALLISAFVVSLLTGKPYIVKVPTHGNVARRPSKTTRSSLYSRILHHVILPPFLWKRILKRAWAFVAISAEIEEELNQAGLGSKIWRITNAVEIDRFKPSTATEKDNLRASLDIPREHFVIVSHGRLEQRKRIDVLIDAMAKLEHNGQPYRVLLPSISDDTELTSRLKTQIHENNLDEVVFILPGSLQPETYLRAADLYVMPSEREGMPNALLEALACGLPCIASEIGGVTDIVTDGEDALLFPVGDSVALSALISTCIYSKATRERLSQNALNTIKIRFTWQTIVEKYITHYKSIVATTESGTANITVDN